ncbi:Gfo/Idh/MocA family protein [Natrinema versiforme]|uniref:Oxidoreductase domain-containing protein n=1 Tax=Natrinema versiforme JCM 10478 TaxID=1227496 RepID=L9XZ75_9EURY|nr:Gfo/Idh/MocA family oxidoreductase [Natrinema versiforme]ELY67134.1 oxidoreductase domain-containing protein [Natrinema versiforme JCM 10478]
MVVRTAVVGAGTVSRAHLAGAQNNPDMELVAVCDLDEELARERAREFGTMAVTDFTELLDELDCLHVCTPVQTHFEIARQAIEAGVGVIIEKPATVTAEEVEQLQTLSREHDTPVTVIHNHLFYPAVRKARELIDAGELGHVKSVDTLYAGLTPPDQVNRGSWVFELPGGEFEEGLPHPIYSVLGIGGWPERDEDISAQTVLSTNYEEDFEYDQAQAQYVSAEGALCNVTMLSGTLPQRLHVITGSEKSLIVDEINQSLYEVDEDYTSSVIARSKKSLDVSLAQASSTLENVKAVATSRFDDSWESETKTNSHCAIFDEFVDAIEGDAEVPVPLEQSKWTIRIMETIRDAARPSREGSAADPSEAADTVLAEEPVTPDDEESVPADL